MPCKNCGSKNEQKLTGELTASLPDPEDVKVSPMYVCQEVLICMDCGFLEMRVPVDKLEPFRKKKTGKPLDEHRTSHREKG